VNAGGKAAEARSAARAMANCLEQVLGKCGCGHELIGNDLLVTGHCTDCKRGLSGLLAGDTPADATTAAATVNRGEFAPLMPGVGVARSDPR
jgi:hypothetical protein